MKVRVFVKMKLSNSFFYTLRENQKDEDSKSGNLLVKAGFIKKSSSGVYMLLPLGFKVYKNIEKIVREEMNKAGSSELLMPCLIPEEVYVKSGRRDNFGSDMFSLKDRFNRAYVLGPTHEELFVSAAKMKIRSYKDMPFNIYQFGTKFRDEPRPRYGLIRVREFVMKDAYSFDSSEEGLSVSYDKMFNAYKNIFDRIGLDYRVVVADTGVMGGLLSEEFQAITDIGEDVVVLCDSCDFASNIEVCECKTGISASSEKELSKELINTPSVGVIDDLTGQGFDIEKLTKTLIYKIDDKFYACVIPASHDVNELKVMKCVNGKNIVLASSLEVEEITGAKVGFAGPIGLDIPVILDEDVLLMKNFLVGANKTDYHYINVNVSDIDDYVVSDIKEVKESDLCPRCGSHLVFKKGIEVGNTFKLGDKYSRSMGLTYLDKDNKERYPMMGCYGLGLERVLASVVEQKSDDKGLVWPLAIAPFKVSIVLLNKDEDASLYANNLYDELNNKGIDTLLDDRNERPGVKFNDMDLIGIPIRITVGKGYNDGVIEFKLRDSDEVSDVKLEDLVLKIENIVKVDNNEEN